MFSDVTLKAARSEDEMSYGEKHEMQKSSSAPATPLVSAINVENMYQVNKNTLAIAYSNKVR